MPTRTTAKPQAASFRELFQNSGLAVTHQRQVIWETLSSMGGHPSPESLFEQVRKRIPSISLATVYKNVNLFVERGLLREVSPHHGPSRIETNREPHDHFVCLRCRSIFDVPDGGMEPAALKKRAPKGFQIHRYTVEVQGLCKRCAGAPAGAQAPTRND